jgi:hypothetical protein
MFNSSRSIESEEFKTMEQEIYDCIINYSNKSEVILKLKELKNLSADELRKIIPWEILNKKNRAKQIIFSGINDILIGVRGLFTRDKYMPKNDTLEFLSLNSEKAYILTYKYYVKSIFDNINCDIKSISKKHKKSYVEFYPHDVSLEKPLQLLDTYSSDETKKWSKITKILDLFQVAMWIFSIGCLIKLAVPFIININLTGLILALLSLGVSVSTIYRIYRYYVKVRKIISNNNDKTAIEIKNRINSDLHPETVANYILNEFYYEVVNELKDRKTITHKLIKFTAIILSVIIVVGMLIPEFKNNQETSKTATSHPNSKTAIKMSNEQNEDIEKYLDKKGSLILYREQMLPEKIKLKKENITGEISGITMTLSLDCTSIIIKKNGEKGIIKMEASVKPKINAEEWEIKTGKFSFWFRNLFLKKYKDLLRSEISLKFRSKESFKSTYQEAKNEADLVAKEKIELLLKNQYPEINEVYVKTNYKPIDFSMNGTDLE